ncbi:hypothetical protein SAMN05446635_3303 [Burkholderia sp. OK233]|nr:hypothetical protein SAMN05446635_3303 [Burkholderia sp. OK233]
MCPSDEKRKPIPIDTESHISSSAMNGLSGSFRGCPFTPNKLSFDGIDVTCHSATVTAGPERVRVNDPAVWASTKTTRGYADRSVEALKAYRIPESYQERAGRSSGGLARCRTKGQLTLTGTGTETQFRRVRANYRQELQRLSYGAAFFLTGASTMIKHRRLVFAIPLLLLAKACSTQQTSTSGDPKLEANVRAALQQLFDTEPLRKYSVR